jgi:hypothetical protein
MKIITILSLSTLICISLNASQEPVPSEQQLPTTAAQHETAQSTADVPQNPEEIQPIQEIEVTPAPPLEPPSFKNLSAWFTLPKFEKGKPILDHMHEYVVSSFGNKTFNLCVLNALAQKINTTLFASSTTRMAVPQFFAVSNQDLSAYLNDAIDLDDLWKQFKKQQGTKKELDAQAIQTLTQIRTKIAQRFSNTNTIPASIQKQIESFIALNPSSLFMVRSTGDGDRTDIANAGGNESVAAVRANVSAIWQAMGIVIQSYFSEKSLRQRLLTSDTITKRYCIPVLIQRMMGEKIWEGQNPANLSEYPVSGVMFTQESAGNTPHIVQIQTAYGHNQGVVNSLVAVDTFYSGPSGLIHPIIRKKMDRLVSMETPDGLMLERISNPTSLQSKPTLPLTITHDLARIAHEVQKIYDYPMDIEFVVKRMPKETTIYLVQARPLIERTFEQKPNCTHPITPCSSIISNYMLPQGSELAARYTDYLEELMSTKSKDDMSKTSLQLLEIVRKSNNRAEIVDALHHIIRRIHTLLETKKPTSLHDETKLILTSAMLCAAEILFTFDNAASITNPTARRLAYLYPITFLEATLMQPANPEILCCHSYAQLKKRFR